MSLVVEESDSNSNPVVSDDRKVTPQYQTEDGKPNVALLQDRTPDTVKASTRVTLLVGVLGVLFILLNYTPLWHTDLWGHLAYGRVIQESGRLPQTEPLMPLASGVRFIDTAWLSQLGGYLVIDQFGVDGIQFLYAVAVLTAASLITFAVYLRTAQVWISLMTLFLLLWAEYQQIIVVRPQLAGLACFTAVFVMATSTRWKTIYTWAIPAIFTVWANLHGSFVIGIVALGALTVGRAIDVLLRTRSLKMMLAESRTRQLFFATELAAIAALLNPYGIGIYGAVFAISGHPNLESLIEWDPLTLRMKQGQAAAFLTMLLMFVYRMTPRKITAGELLLLFGLGGATLWTSRFIVWWAVVAAYYFGLHAAGVWRTWIDARLAEPKRGGAYTVATLGLLWIAFAYTPFGGSIIHGAPTDEAAIAKNFRKRVSETTPIDAAAYLKDNPPQGLIFNIYEWGDYLLWAGPDNLQVFVASHAHLIPTEIWQDYLAISQAGLSWNTKLDRYGVNTVVIHRSKQAALVNRLESYPEIWEQVFIDDRSVIFVRKEPV